MRTIFGQDRAVDVLEAALAGQRVHHAWIFHGPHGVGKFTTARRFARILLCHEPMPDAMGRVEACGRCRSCTALSSEGGVHPDLHIIHKELASESSFGRLRGKKQANIPIDLLRERMIGGYIDTAYVDAVVAKSPMLGHHKVFIIDEAELLDSSGQNALLKTLEEPSAGTYIILVTTAEHRLLPTIRSRCQRVIFHHLSDEAIERWLDRHGHTALTGPQRRAVLRFAQGSLGRALLAIAFRFDGWYETLDPMLQRTMAGHSVPELGPTMAQLVEDFAQAWVKGRANASKESANAAGVRHMLSLLGGYCHKGLTEAAAHAAGLSPEQADQALRPSLAGLELIHDAQQHLASHVSAALLLDNLAVQWALNSSPHPAGR
jgi:DNA polymerase-3 subunit delta'